MNVVNIQIYEVNFSYDEDEDCLTCEGYPGKGARVFCKQTKILNGFVVKKYFCEKCAEKYIEKAKYFLSEDLE